uniref:ATP-dependent DNA helicase n=1 Tax=Strigamia maritima TaxID=126957 RepID=T1J2E1_STRMM
MFISKCGGTGKSYFINVLDYYIETHFQKHTAKTAPTGVAALNINGVTLHKLLQLPVQHRRTPKYYELNDMVLHTIRRGLKDVALIVIEEISIVSNIMLLYIHYRLTEIFETTNEPDGWFEGKNIIALGNLMQLPPVMDDPSFIQIAEDKIKQHTAALHATNIWQNTFSFDELSVNQRQNKDPVFANILNNIRIGRITAEQSALLASRMILTNTRQLQVDEIVKRIEELPANTVCIFPKREMCALITKKCWRH